MTKQFARAALAGAMMIATSVASAQTGNLTGTVLDRATRRPLDNVSVVVVGTLNGTMTKANGTYTILGVPQGSYIVEAKRVGYRTVRAEGVTVNANARRTQDFELDMTHEVRAEPVPPPMRYATTPPRPEPGSVTPPPSTSPMVEMGMVGAPSFENMLFPPELVMQHQRALELTSDQRRAITDAVKALQNQTVELQWNLQAEQQALVSLLEKRPINEQAAVAQMAKLVDLEDAVKRTHLATLIKIKNALTDKQIEILNSQRRQRWDYPPPPERRDWESFSTSRDWRFDYDWSSDHDRTFDQDWTFDHDWSFDRDWTFPHGWTFPSPFTRRQQQH
jgi:Spy/CpxP family protein refolding chaperone